MLGPASVRDLAGRVGDVYVTPTSWDFLDHADGYVRPALQGLDLLSDLPDRISTYDSLHRAALDPYIALRNAYVQFRAGEVAQ